MLLLSPPPGWASDNPWLAVLAGLVLLVVGAEFLVRGAIWIALTLGMSRMTVGLTLVAIGTSLPELLVSVTAAHTGRAAIAMANVLGSNVANVLLIVGAAAAIRAIRLQTRWLELGYLLLMSGLACLPFVAGAFLERWMAAVMIATLALFCTQLLARERAARRLAETESRPQSSLPAWGWNLLRLAIGLALLAYGAEWLVDGAATIAVDFGMSEAVVGMTIVAVGTSLPELATSVVAAARGQPEISIGNIVGSNIFNVGAVLGVAGLIEPFPVDVPALSRLLVMTGVSAVLLVLVLRRLQGVPRAIGVVFLLAYAGFLAHEVLTTRPA